jgi:peptidoglycan/xylan/chitin deacetylase (PgdA/CDA1 family)
MISRLLNRIKSVFVGKSIILMYHRIAEPELDIWDLAVSPERFEQQLKVLRKRMKVISLKQMIQFRYSVRNKVAITFDDGYIDNFKIAKPLLEKYNIPATFFIASKTNQMGGEYWWDDLERYILSNEKLPPVFKIFFKGQELVFDLHDEIYLTAEIRQLHRQWKAYREDPPTLRAKLFYELWKQLQILPYEDQNEYLEMIRNWANVSNVVRPEYKIMSAAELKQLAGTSLFTLGSHTTSHPALAYHDEDFQKREITENRNYLQEITGKNINFLAYPYGNFNGDTLMIVSNLGFDAAFTTEETTLQSSFLYKLGRFQVKNLTGHEFRNQLKYWLL